MAQKVTNTTVSTPVVVPGNAAGFVDWSPVFAGALAAAAISFVLYSFGATIGLSLVSPWPNSGLPVAVVAGLAVFWLMASQIGSFLAGGYIAGRMRSPWSDTAAEEVQFRDGLHGMLVWALGVVISAVLVTATAASLVRGGAEVAARLAGGAASLAASADPLAYYTDVLSRPAERGAGTTAAQRATTDAQAAAAATAREEVLRVLQRSLASGRLAGPDKNYLVQLVAQRTGLPPQEAEKRVDETVAEAGRAAREAADKARRGAILSGLVTTATLLVALAAAWWAAQQGGQHRDNAIHPTLFRQREWPSVRKARERALQVVRRRERRP